MLSCQTHAQPWPAAPHPPLTRGWTVAPTRYYTPGPPVPPCSFAYKDIHTIVPELLCCSALFHYSLYGVVLNWIGKFRQQCTRACPLYVSSVVMRSNRRPLCILVRTEPQASAGNASSSFGQNNTVYSELHWHGPFRMIMESCIMFMLSRNYFAQSLTLTVN